MLLIAVSFAITSVVPVRLVSACACCDDDTPPRTTDVVREEAPRSCCQKTPPADDGDRDDTHDHGPFDCDCPGSCCAQILPTLDIPGAASFVFGDPAGGRVPTLVSAAIAHEHTDDIDHPPRL